MSADQEPCAKCERLLEAVAKVDGLRAERDRYREALTGLTVANTELHRAGYSLSRQREREIRMERAWAAAYVVARASDETEATHGR